MNSKSKFAAAKEAKALAKGDETKHEEPRHYWERPCTVECAVPRNWNEAQDRDFVSDCINEPDQGQRWHEHCMEHVTWQIATLHRALDGIFCNLVPGISDSENLLPAMTILDKVGAVRKLVASQAAELHAAQLARMMPGSPVPSIGEFLAQVQHALDHCECVDTLRGRC